MAPIPSNIPRSFQAWNALAAGTTSEFNLDAGVYGLLLVWSAGTATLEKLVAGTTATWAPVSAAIAASSYTVLQLPAGRYRLNNVTGPITGEIALIARGGFR